MRTLASVLVVFAIAVAGSMMALSGFGAVWGADPPQTQAAQDQLDDSAAQANPNDEPISGPVSSGESDIVGLIANGSSAIVDFAAAVVLLPITLIKMGFPAWFALPIGSVAYLIAGVGAIEFVTNREWT
jgi:hypothetical protein